MYFLNMLSIASQLKDVVEGIKQLVEWIAEQASSLFKALTLIPEYLVYTYRVYSFLPGFFLAFAGTYISVRMIYTFLGWE